MIHRVREILLRITPWILSGMGYGLGLQIGDAYRLSVFWSYLVSVAIGLPFYLLALQLHAALRRLEAATGILIPRKEADEAVSPSHW